jgi:DNA polymerase I
MITISERLASERITFKCLESKEDIAEYKQFVFNHRWLALDTESTGLDCYVPSWRLRMFQCGDSHTSYVVPQRFRRTIAWTMSQPINWIGHNGPHDIRCIDVHLGYETGVQCIGETHITSHHDDSRNRAEGGVGHELKELAIAYVDRDAGRWEVELKRIFKTIEIPIEGEVYKSGPRKGSPKIRKAKIAEGWGLIDPNHPAYIAYAAADPILTYRVWKYFRPVFRTNKGLYRFDWRVALACDALQRRGMPLDVEYTKRLSRAYTRKAEQMMAVAHAYGCENIHSGQQLAKTLLDMGVRLTDRTPTGQYTMDNIVLRRLLASAETQDVATFINAVLVAKQCLKRRESYTDACLAELDSEGRVHASINSLAARTARMSVSRPALQQLPTKDREEEIE